MSSRFFAPIFPITYCCGLLLVLISSSCNTTMKDPRDHSAVPATSAYDKDASNTVGYDEFKNMSVEERWHSLSPARRNSLRQDPNRYQYFKNMIAAEPDMEEVPLDAPADPPPAVQVPAFSDINIEWTPEQWWNSFDESRKQYIRTHPDEYPQFKPFF